MRTIRPGIIFLVFLAILAWPVDSPAREAATPALAGQTVPSPGDKGRALLAQAPKGASQSKNGRSFSEAFQWFEKSAMKGNKNAQHMIGLMYYDGDGVKKNYGEARNWFEKAAKQSHDSAQYMLGLTYYYGRGVKKNFPAATKWFVKAAKQSHDSAQYMLGLIYYDGKGVKKNLDEAEKWFRKAAGQGDQDAQYMIGLVIYERAKGEKAKKQ